MGIISDVPFLILIDGPPTVGIAVIVASWFYDYNLYLFVPAFKVTCRALLPSLPLSRAGSGYSTVFAIKPERPSSLRRLYFQRRQCASEGCLTAVNTYHFPAFFFVSGILV